jgi:hypothetical protein
MRTNIIQTASACGSNALPALARLGLSERERNALSRQGFVSAERRNATSVYKLRFRFTGRQRVIYLGTSAQQALAVEADLAVLQQGVRARRQLAALHRHAAKRLKKIKSFLQPMLESRGFHFHGLAVRKRRNSKAMAELDRDC